MGEENPLERVVLLSQTLSSSRTFPKKTEGANPT